MANFGHPFRAAVGSIPSLSDSLTDFVCSGAREGDQQASIPSKTAKNPLNSHNRLSTRYLRAKTIGDPGLVAGDYKKG
jgi:hypothetical protein